MSKDTNHLIQQISQLLSHLKEDDLKLVGRKVHKRLKIFYTARNVHHMKRFNLHDRVYFSRGNSKIVGQIVRINQRTLTLHADDGSHWNVSPTLLHRAA